MVSENLIELWIEVETRVSGRRLADALRDLNDEIGTSYVLFTVWCWRRGTRQPSSAAQRYMRAVTIERALILALGEPIHGMYSDDQLDLLARLLSTPDPRAPA